MKDENKIIIIFIITICVFMMFCIITGLIKDNINKSIDCNKTPVEEIRTDTLYITRDNYKTIIQYLDSIQHDTIEKVYRLNDTASVELFYKLVSD